MTVYEQIKKDTEKAKEDMIKRLFPAVNAETIDKLAGMRNKKKEMA